MSTASVPRCNYCGQLERTLNIDGHISHKHGCPNRTDPFCQAHPRGCPEWVDQYAPNPHRPAWAGDYPRQEEK